MTLQLPTSLASKMCVKHSKLLQVQEDITEDKRGLFWIECCPSICLLSPKGNEFLNLRKRWARVPLVVFKAGCTKVHLILCFLLLFIFRKLLNHVRFSGVFIDRNFLNPTQSVCGCCPPRAKYVMRYYWYYYHKPYWQVPWFKLQIVLQSLVSNQERVVQFS